MTKKKYSEEFLNEQFDVNNETGEVLEKRATQVRLPISLSKIVRSLPNRSQKLRQWIREGAEREGLLRPPDN